MNATGRPTDPWRDRVDGGDWAAITAELDEFGGALLPQLLTATETAQIRDLYPDEWLAKCHAAGQQKSTATLLPRGHGNLFTTRDRPVRSARGWSAAPVRHGVSAVRSGHRTTLALVFHDAA